MIHDHTLMSYYEKYDQQGHQQTQHHHHFCLDGITIYTAYQHMTQDK